MSISFSSKWSVILTGTDPDSRQGGIGYALPGYLDALEILGIQYESIPTYSPSQRLGTFWPWLRHLPRIARRILAIRASGQQPIVYCHAGAGVSLLREGVVLFLSRLCGAQGVIQLHAPEIDGYLKSPLKRRLFFLAISRAHALSVLTPWWRHRLKSAGINLPIFVISNPLPKIWQHRATNTPAPTTTHDRGIVKLLALARLEPGKGLDLLIDAMPFLPNHFHLSIGGSGSQENALKQKVHTLGLEEQIHFLGWIEGTQKQKVIEESDLFCLPTRYDSFGMGFLEAMANGLPVVALNWGAIGDVVPHNRAGLLIDEADPKALASAIRKLDDPTLRRTMGIEAKKWVLETFSTRVIGEKIHTMMQTLVDHDHSR